MKTSPGVVFLKFAKEQVSYLCCGERESGSTGSGATWFSAPSQTVGNLCAPRTRSLRCYVNVKRQVEIRGACFGLRCSIDSLVAADQYCKIQLASRGAV